MGNTRWRTSTIKHYDLCAQEYAAFAETQESTDLLGDVLHALPEAGRVLDLGCGSGRDAKYLRHIGHHVVGLDLSLGLLREGTKRSDIPVVQAAMQKVPIASSAIDAVIALGSYHHLDYRSQQLALDEMARVARPGAPVLITVKLINEMVTETHPEFGSSRQFFPTDPDRLAIEADSRGLVMVRSILDEDGAGRDVTWLRATFVRATS